MFYIIKGLYFNYKVRAYNKAIIAMTAARAKLKAKQAKCTASYEKYQAKLANHNKG